MKVREYLHTFIHVYERKKSRVGERDMERVYMNDKFKYKL